MCSDPRSFNCRPLHACRQCQKQRELQPLMNSESLKSNTPPSLLSYCLPVEVSPKEPQFYKRLATMLAEKWDQPYSTTIGWLRCTFSFSLLRSAVQCLRGARSSKGRAARTIPLVDVVAAESNLTPC